MYQNKEVLGHNDLHPECTDFVYEIRYTNGQKYIGKKTVRSIRRKKPTKAQLEKRKNYVRKEMTNLPFANYEGSHGKDLGLVIESKHILYQCRTKKAATYLEAALLFHYDAIFDPNFVNENIGGKFFDSDLDGKIEDDEVELPVKYDEIPNNERWKIREQYLRQQNGKCLHCGNSLHRAPSQEVIQTPVNEELFPQGFFNHPLHLHHCHETGMTIGTVHARCNAVLWQYEGK